MNISIWKGFGIMWPAENCRAATGVLTVASEMRPYRSYPVLSPIQLAAAIGLDLFFGDPRDWPHITRLTGWLAERYERFLTNSGQRTVTLGVVFWCSVVGTLLVLYVFARRFCGLHGSGAVLVLDTVIIYQAIAAKDLHCHAEAVLRPLLCHDLVEARKRLSFVVGRDTQSLDESEIAKAVIESVAESLTDGIIAPLFWSMIGGAPGALVYRAANTLDSMVGHMTDLYEKFGRTSARVDDFLNWLPARFCAILFCLCKPENLLATIHLEAGGHASPNAGWGESAMAHVLGVRLGGENFYDGELVRGPVFNAAGRRAGIEDIQRSLNWMWRISAAGAGIILVTTFFLNKLRLK
jgi:adenosylcobinamide-phosphate synthase